MTQRIEDKQQMDTACNRGRLVVFDFDGTSIAGSSPVTLVKYLTRKRMLGPTYIARIIAWGFAYAWHIPQNEAWVRGLVFSAFEGKPKEQVDAFLREFYDKEIEPLYRPIADKTMRQHIDKGDTVVVISATFEPIVLRAMEKHAFEHQVSVCMAVDEKGCYTRQVIGAPVEGEEKVRCVERFGNQMFGEGNWELAYAYADHYSDIPLLEMAKHAIAVSPGPVLAREAKRRGWEIVEW